MDLANFVITYFATKNLNMITAFVCWSPVQVWVMWRVASSAGVRVTIQTDFQRIPEMNPYGMFREGMLLDLSCPSAEVVLEKASIFRGFNYRHSWLLLHNSSYDRDVLSQTLEPYAILPDADVAWSATDHLVDVYRVKQDQPYMLIVLGLARNSSSEDLNAVWGVLPTAVARRKNLHGVTLAACAVIAQPQVFTSWSDERHRDDDVFPKLTYPLIMLTAQDFNYHVNLMQVSVYGMCVNDSFDGLAGLLQRRRVELGVASVFMRSDRMRVLHYSAETYNVVGKFIFRQPPRSAVSNVFVLPFSGGVWAALGGSALAAAALLPALCAVRARCRPAPASLQVMTLPECCTFAFGALCQQGFHNIPPVLSVQLVMFWSLLSALFAFTAYSAKVVALLQTPSDAIRSLQDLARAPIALGVQDTTYKTVYYAESTYGPTRELFLRKLQPQGAGAYRTVRAGVARVRRGNYAFQMESNSGYDMIKRTFTEREKCSLKEIEAFKLPMAAIPLKKHSGYRDLFGSRLRWQREVGLMERWRRRWVSARPGCAAGGGGFLRIGLRDVAPAVQMLVSVVLLAAERACGAAPPGRLPVAGRRSPVAGRRSPVAGRRPPRFNH